MSPLGNHWKQNVNNWEKIRNMTVGGEEVIKL